MLCFRHLSRLLARVDYIGSVDKITGKAELRFHLQGLEKAVRNHGMLSGFFV